MPKYQFREWKFVTLLIQSIQNRVGELDLTDGIQIRDFIHVDDVASSYLAVLNHLEELPGYHSFEVDTGVSRTVRGFAETVHAELDGTTKLNFGKLPRKDTEIMYSTARIERLT